MASSRFTMSLFDVDSIETKLIQTTDDASALVIVFGPNGSCLTLHMKTDVAKRYSDAINAIGATQARELAHAD